VMWCAGYSVLTNAWGVMSYSLQMRGGDVVCRVQCDVVQLTNAWGVMWCAGYSVLTNAWGVM